MTEQSIHHALNETTDFVQRQKLFRQLWKLHRANKTDAPVATLDASYKVKPAKQRKERMPAENAVA